jgi:hypothetical protein
LTFGHILSVKADFTAHGCYFVTKKEKSLHIERLKRIEEKIEEYMDELDRRDREEGAATKDKTAAETNGIIKGLKERKGKYEAIAEELERTGERQKSLADSGSRLMLSNGKMDVCYNVRTAADAKHKLIAEFEVTNNANDMNQIAPMAEKVMEILEVEKIAITADKGYGRSISRPKKESLRKGRA